MRVEELLIELLKCQQADNMKHKIIKYTVFTLGMLVVPVLLFAQVADTPRGGAMFKSPIQFTSVAQVMNGFFKVLVQIGAVAVTLAIVYAGFLFVAARGNPEELTKARETLKWTIIGALILLGAQVIAKAIENTIKTISS